MRDVQNLTTEQVKAAMAKHLDPEALVVVTAGPTVPQKELPPPTDRPAELPSTVPH
jgi:zinc protease